MFQLIDFFEASFTIKVSLKVRSYEGYLRVGSNAAIFLRELVKSLNHLEGLLSL